MGLLRKKGGDESVTIAEERGGGAQWSGLHRIVQNHYFVTYNVTSNECIAGNG